MIAIREAWIAGLFSKKHWAGNVIAGVIVGVVALPLALAFAIASGATPEQGIYTAIVAGLAVSLFGGSRLQIAGPTGAFVVILATITAEHGMAGLQIATLMAGVILVALGIARMGMVIRYIPAPVIIGFTAGIGVIIWVGQWQAFLGLPAASGKHFHEKFWHLLALLPHLHFATTALAIASLLITLYSTRLPYMQRVPGPLVALVFVTVLQALFHFEGVATIGSAFGGIPQGLPQFQWPAITLTRLVELAGPAFAIAMLGAIESLLSAVVADGMAGTRHNSNQELIGQGIANILAPLFGGFAATGAIARTATNVRNGANSPLAGIMHALTLVLIILLLAPLAAAIPLCTLAAILFVVAWNMSEAKHFLHMVKHAPTADVAILLITFTLTVFTDLVVAVNIGVLLAMLTFLGKMAASVEVRLNETDALQQQIPTLDVPDNVLVYSIDGPFFFAAVDTFEQVLAQIHHDPRTLIIRLGRVPFIDATGLESLSAMIGNLAKRNVQVLFCEASERVQKKLQRAALLLPKGKSQHYPDLANAINACRIDN